MTEIEYKIIGDGGFPLINWTYLQKKNKTNSQYREFGGEEKKVSISNILKSARKKLGLDDLNNDEFVQMNDEQLYKTVYPDSDSDNSL